jgi:AcrR family transcriptional regulator
VSEKTRTSTRIKGKSPSPVAAEVIKGGPTRRGVSRERSEHLESRVLDAAIEEFAEHGFSGARIERISQRAGTVDRMLYYYYGNKDRLYQAVLEKIYADMISAQRDFVLPDDPVDAMRQLVQHSWDHYVSHPNLVRLLMNENLLRGRHIQQSNPVKKTLFPLVETVATILANGQKKGVFRADTTTEHVLMTIMSLGFFYVSNQYTCSTWMGGDIMKPARRTAWRAHICEVVLGHLQPKSKPPALTTAAKKRAARQ